MDVTPLIAVGSQVIQSYSAGRFKISGHTYEGAVVVYPDRTEIWDMGGDFSRLSPENIDVVLYGCGQNVPDDVPHLRRRLKETGLNVEIMTTGAACRTYNVLMAEGRRVVAALLPV